MSEREGIIIDQEKGEKAEKKVYDMLDFLKMQKFIENFGQSFGFSETDYRGVDFEIYHHHWKKPIQIQVKSSFPKWPERKYLKRQGIHLLICKPEDNSLQVLEKIYQILKSVIRAKNRAKAIKKRV